MEIIKAITLIMFLSIILTGSIFGLIMGLKTPAKCIKIKWVFFVSIKSNPYLTTFIDRREDLVLIGARFWFIAIGLPWKKDFILKKCGAFNIVTYTQHVNEYNKAEYKRSLWMPAVSYII